MALVPRATPSRLMAVLSPVIAIVLTIAIGLALLTAMGRDAGEAINTYFILPFADPYSRAELLVKATPLALIGSGLALAFRAGVFNIGAPGQYTLGAIAAGLVALAAPQDAGPWLLVACLVAGGVGGLAWGAIPAYLRARHGVNEILVSLMLTYVAALLLDYLVRGPLRDPLGFGFPQTADFPAGAMMPLMLDGTRLHFGVILAVVAALILWLVMARSVMGLHLRLAGEAPRAAVFAGFAKGGAVWRAMLISGGLAGLAGSVEATSTIGQLQPNISAEYGFAAIIAAFLGRLHPVGAVGGAVVLAVTYIGGENAQILMNLPRNAVLVFQGLLLFVLLAADTLVQNRIVWGPR